MDENECDEVPYRHFIQSLYNFKSHDPLQATIVMVRQMKPVKQILKHSICAKECLSSTSNRSSQFQDALQHASLTELFDSLSKIVSSISGECTRLSTISDDIQLQCRHCHSKLFHSTSEVFPKPDQHHIVNVSMSVVANFTVQSETGEMFIEPLHSPKESPFQRCRGMGLQSQGSSSFPL